MPRKTDTRERVFAIARELSAAGISPTFSLVQAKLGRGSPNTISSALRAWRSGEKSGQGGAGLGASQGPPGLAGASLLEPLGSALLEMRLLSSRLAESLEECRQQRQWFQGQLDLMQSRYAAVQTRMLLAIDEARQSSVELRERLRQSQQELETWRVSMASKNTQLQVELAQARAALGSRQSFEPSADPPPFGTD